MSTTSRATVSVVTCAEFMDCVYEQRQYILGPGTKGLISNNRKFICN